MSGDFSRRTYDPRRDVAGVFEQQGRVRVDADLNELVEVIDRRFRTTSMDVFHASAGRVTVPAETPDAFLIAIGGGGLTIGPGRAYVDGIQADNHGIGVPPPTALHFDGGIEEKVGTDPLPFSPQPYLPTAVQVPPQGTHLAYLDVWHRERTKDEDTEQLDPALYGIDTATRRQIVWQVKLLTNVDNVRCDTPIDQIAGLPLRAAARLTTAAVGVPAADDPCEIPALGGYRGVTNRLYRVEIHDGGGFGQATFTWSRNGGSGGTSIVAVNGAAITVAQLGRDKYVRFATGDWVEVLDEERELLGLPGEMAKVDRVDEARGIVTLTAPLGSPVGTDARLRKWDQRVAVPPSGVFPVTNGPVVLEDGVQIQFSLDPEINGGTLRTHEYWLFAARAADSSVEVLDEAPPVGPHHHIGKLAIVDTAAGTVVDCRHPWPPRCGCDGCECDECVHANEHNVDRLGIQRAIDAVRGKGGIVCLEAGIYILDRPVRITKATSITIRGKGWRTIVLTPGDLPAFVVEQSFGVIIEELSVLGVRRSGGFTTAPSAGPSLVESSLSNASLTNVAARRASAATTTLPSPVELLRLAGGQIAIALSNSVRVLVQRCVLAIRPRARLDAPVVAMQGILTDLTIRENVILGCVGIGTLQRSKVTRRIANKPGAPTLADHFDTLDSGDSVDGTSAAAAKRQTAAARLSRLLLLRSRVDDNIIGGLVAGIALGPFTILAADNVVADNTIVAPLVAGTLHMGIALPGGTTIRANTIYAGGFGIVSGLDGMRVDDNDVFGFSIGRAFTLNDSSRATIGSSFASSAASTVLSLPVAGITLVDGLGFNRPLEGARISGNRVTGVRGFGILGASRVATVDVEHNIVSECALGGIVMVGISGGAAVIDGNMVEHIARTQVDTTSKTPIADLAFYLENFVAGIAVVGMLDVDARDNHVELVLSQTREAAPIGILAMSCGDNRVAGNCVVDIGDDKGYAAGIAIGGTFDKADVVDDRVRIGSRFERDPAQRWNGIIISGFDRREAVEIKVTGISATVSTTVIAAPQRVAVGRANPHFAEVADGKLLRVIPVGRELIAARGNTVDGGGAEAMVLAFGRGNTTVSDNRVVVDPAARQPGIAAVGSSLIANANYVELNPKEPAMQLGTFAGAATVLGNVTQGTIELDGNNIQSVPPWAPLNVSS